MKKRSITILGSTGSIGVNTVNVIKTNNHLFDVYALSGNSQVELLFNQCMELNPKYAVVVTEKSANRLKEKLIEHGSKTSVIFGLDGFIQVSTSNEVDIIMSVSYTHLTLPTNQCV